MVRVKKQTMEAVETKVNETLNAKADVSNMEQEAEAIKQTKNESGFVWVCCGIPCGQILRGVGGRDVLLNGIPVSKLVSAYQDNMPLYAGKFGVTKVPEEDWNSMKEEYKLCDFMRNATIFACKTKEEAEEQGKARFNEHLGFEQADPEKGNTKPVEDKEE